jgi:hypothetical protein
MQKSKTRYFGGIYFREGNLKPFYSLGAKVLLHLPKLNVFFKYVVSTTELPITPCTIYFFVLAPLF